MTMRGRVSGPGSPRRRTCLGGIRTAAAIVFCWAPAPSALAETPRIIVAAEVRVAAGVAAPMPVIVGPASAIPQGVLFLIRGLPPNWSVSEGQQLSPDAWFVPPADAPKLKITAPATAEGAAHLSLVLVTYDGSLLAQAKMNLVISAPTAQKAVGSHSNEDLERARKYTQKGDESLLSGNVAAARLFYQRAVEAGWAPAALALGGTYDAAELSRTNLLAGVLPEPDQARKWYEKARELGDKEAGRRLVRLSQP
jgi:hypothetical protein